MKLFVWKNVLCDYTCGMAFAYAQTLEDALKCFPDYVRDQLGAPIKVIDCDKRKIRFGEFTYGSS